VAAEIAKGASDLVVGHVGIGTYGEKINQDLAERYGFKKAGAELEYKDLDDNFPKFIFFPKGTAWNGQFQKYEGAANAQDMMRFLKTNGVKVGLQGTIAALDSLAAKFLKADETTRKQLTDQATQIAVEAAEKDSKDYYLKVMQRIADKGEGFVKTEIKRLENLQTSALAKDKQDQFKRRANILTSFLPSDEL